MENRKFAYQQNVDVELQVHLAPEVWRWSYEQSIYIVSFTAAVSMWSNEEKSKILPTQNTEQKRMLQDVDVYIQP